MSTKNKKNLASQALLEMDAITSAIKEESKNTLNTLLAEAVRNALREGCEEEEDKEYDVVDDEQNDAEEKENDSDDSAKTDVDEDGDAEMSGQAAPAPEEDHKSLRGQKPHHRKRQLMAKVMKVGMSFHSIKQAIIHMTSLVRTTTRK